MFNKVQSLETLEPVSAFFDYKLITRRGYFEFELTHVSQVQWPPMMVEVYLLTSEQDKAKIDSLVVCTLNDPGRELLFPSFRYGQLTLESSSLEIMEENMSVNRLLTLSNNKGSKFSLKCPDKIQIQYWKGQLENLFPKRMADIDSLYSSFRSETASSSMQHKTSSSYSFSTRNSEILSDTSFEGLNILKPLESPLPRALSEYPSLSVDIPSLRKTINRRPVSKRFTKTPRLSLNDLSMAFGDAPELKAFMDALKGEDQHVEVFDPSSTASETITAHTIDESDHDSPVFTEVTTLLPKSSGMSTSEEDFSDSHSDIDSESYYSDDDNSDSVLEISSQFEFCDVNSARNRTSIPMDSALSALQSNPGISLETLYQAEVVQSSTISLPTLPISLPPCPPVPRSSDNQSSIQIVNDKQLEVDDMDRDFQSQDSAKKSNTYAESFCISLAASNLSPKHSQDRIATSKRKDPSPTHRYGLSIYAGHDNLEIASSDLITPSQSSSSTHFNALSKVLDPSENVGTTEEEQTYTRPALKRKSSAKKLVGVFKTLASKLKTKSSSSGDNLTTLDDTRSKPNSLDAVPYELRDPIQVQSTTMSGTEFCERPNVLSMQDQQDVPAPQVDSLFIDSCSSIASSALLKEANSVPMRRGKASRAEKALSKISEEFFLEDPKSFDIGEEEPGLGIASADAMLDYAEGQGADLCNIDSTEEGLSNKTVLQTSISTKVTAVGQGSPPQKISSLTTIALPELETELNLEEDMLFKSRSFVSSIGTAVDIESNNATIKHGHARKLSNGISLRSLFGSDSSFTMSRKSSIESSLTDVSSIPALEPEPIKAPALSSKLTVLKTQAMVSKWDSMSWVRISESLVDVLICVSSNGGSISCTLPLPPSRHSLNVIAEEDEDSEEEIVPMPSPVLTLSLNSRNSHLMRRTAFDVHLRTGGDTTYLFRLLSSRSADEFMSTVSMGSMPTSSVVPYRKYY